jgi:ribosomal protein S18 acetylase RimI-like enzyme
MHAVESGHAVIATALGDCDVLVASLEDAEPVLGLRDALAAWLVDNGITQWQPGEIDIASIRSLIADGSVYVLRHRRTLVGSVTITTKDTLVWGERYDLSGYIHRLLIARSFAGRRLGASLLEWSESHIRSMGGQLARLDCVRTNERLRRYYEAAGYQRVGYRDFPEIDWANEVALYERPLT